MRQLLACTVCFITNVKLIHLDCQGLRPVYDLISGQKTCTQNGLPQYVCFECAAILRKITKFRDKCQRAFYTLQQIQNTKNYITILDIECLNKKLINVTPLLSFMKPSRFHYEETQFEGAIMNRVIGLGVPIVTYSTTEDRKFVTINLVLGQPKDENEDSTAPDVKVKVAEVSEHSEDYNEDEEKSVEDEMNVNDTNIPEVDRSENGNDNFDDDVYYISDEDHKSSQNVIIEEPGACSLHEEYGTMVALTKPEIIACVEVLKLSSQGSQFRCEVCCKGFSVKNRLKIHARMHDVHTSGLFECQFCLYRYKTDNLLKIHLSDKHMFKYLCKKCPEVSFDRCSAKRHFICSHTDKPTDVANRTDVANQKENRPKWLSMRGGHRNRNRRAVIMKPKRKPPKLPEDFLKLVPIEHNEQYTLILERKKSRNYIEAPFKCEYCYRGFLTTTTFNTHMKKHDPAISGKYQCDMCKLYLQHPRKMYSHMNAMHLYKYFCQKCNYVCFNRSQAHNHYRWHGNVKYKCPHCEEEFMKMSTRTTHIRVKHPSNCICNLCGHSFVSELGLSFHKRFAHKDTEQNVPQINKDHPLYCPDCDIQFANDAAFMTHLGSASKHATINKSCSNMRWSEYKKNGRKLKRRPTEMAVKITDTKCEHCDEKFPNDVQARKHYQQVHPGKPFLKRYMCDVCGHITRQLVSLQVHMRTHTREKPYVCPHCDKKFTMPSSRDRHLLVHTGERRHKCQHCNKRFTQNNTLKLHIQTVHLKIPYEPWVRARQRRKCKNTDLLTEGPVVTSAIKPNDNLNNSD